MTDKPFAPSINDPGAVSTPRGGAIIPPHAAIPAKLLAAALWYAAHGWHVFPIYSIRNGGCSCGADPCKDAGKHPRTAHGLSDATTDPQTIKGWWQRWPDASIGIATGAKSGIVVLDVDPRHGGDESLAALEAEHGKLPATVECLTGGGGRHLYFAHPGGHVKSRQPMHADYPGLDQKADGGYVLVPPSNHRSGKRYEWELSSRPEATPVATLPAWLLALMCPPTTSSNGHDKAPAVGDHIPAGQRNAALASLAGSMRRRGMTEAAILAALMAENAAKCDPPLPDDEVRRIAASVARYEPAQEDEPTNGREPPQDWEPPTPFFHVDVPAFPTEAFPRWLRDYVEAEAIATQTPPDLPGMLVLSSLSTACAKKVAVRVRDGWQEPVNVYTVTALPPGNRKSAVFEDVAGPIEEHERAETERLAPQLAEAESRYRVAKGRLEHTQAQAAKAKPGEGGELLREAGDLARELAAMAVPAMPRLIVDDCTPEKLSTLLRDQGGRLAVLSAEGDVFDLMAGRYSEKGGNFGVFLRGHAGDPLRVDRVGRPPEFVRAPALTMGLAAIRFT